MSEILATINGKEITSDDLQQFFSDLPQEQRQYISDPNARDYFKEQMIAMYLYEIYGEELKLPETDEFKKRMDNARRNILSQLAVEEMFKNIKITEEDKVAFFNENKNRFATGAQASAKHILMADEDAIKKVMDDINAGAISFEDAAKANSTCPSASKGGDLGTFGPGQMVKEFDEAVFTGEVGKVLGPVKTQFGYHLIKIESRTDGAEPVYEDVAAYIESQLLQEKRSKLYTDKLVELQNKYQK